MKKASYCVKLYGMKNLMFSCLVSSLLIGNLYAGDREWAVAGKVVTGVAAVTIIDRIVNPPPVVIYQQPMIVQAPVVVQPQPVIIQPVPIYYSTPVIVYRPYYHYGYRSYNWHHR